MIQKKNEGSLRGIKIGSSCPPVSHLLFADDLIIFANADGKDVEVALMSWKTMEDGQGRRSTKRNLEFVSAKI